MVVGLPTGLAMVGGPTYRGSNGEWPYLMVNNGVWPCQRVAIVSGHANRGSNGGWPCQQG